MTKITIPPNTASGWQPIETAPIMEAVLVYGRDCKYPCSASWSGIEDEEWFADAGGVIHGEIGWPTHWMPLPAPPEVTK